MLPLRRWLLASLTLVGAFSSSAAEYRVDRNHSNLGFAAPILGGLSKVHGKFTDFTVELKFNAADLADSEIRAVIKPASIDTGITDRDEHLRGDDFFMVATFPEAVFESTKIEAAPGGYIAHGKLTIRDVTKEIDVPFAVTGRSEKADEKGKLETLGFIARATIDRRDFGMVWKHSIDPLFVGDLIELEITIVTRPRRMP
ncbi:MAG: polyisoprenoid-binding protein [Opitutus sp.]|nr:polyisoprenoid-binding protein [Opitutus sp.]